MPDLPDPENPNHVRLPGTSMFIDTTGGKFTARNVPPPPPAPQPQAASVTPQFPSDFDSLKPKG